MLTALIMAGGKGERFWPLSSSKKPKQFLKLLGNKSMIQMTYERINPLIPADRIFVVTTATYLNLVNEQLPEIPPSNIIIEPVGRNTGPCITLASLIIVKKIGNCSLLVLPSDHLIQDEKQFRNDVESAQAYLEKDENAIITFGIKPTRPETNFGYIKFENNSNVFPENQQIKKSIGFVEKPNIEKANEYLLSHQYFWNAGIFLWNINCMNELLKKHLFDSYSKIYNIIDLPNDNFTDKLNDIYPTLESNSVDYAVLEKANNIFVFICRFTWDDIGTWNSIERYIKPDKEKNILLGDIFMQNSENNLIVSNNKPIIIVGIKDIFAVEGDEQIYIGRREDIDKISQIKKVYEDKI